jgi:RNA polymerase sigma-70 factor (sigma-E family)
VSAPEGFEEYVAARLPALSRTAYLLTGHHQDAEDLVQRALVKVVAVWPRIADHPDPYVKRVMYHDNVSRWRRRGRRPEHLTDELPERLTTDDATLRLALEDALARLTPKQRTVLVLRFYEDLTETQTAEAMGVGLGTVKSQTRHALKRLKELSPGLESLLVG